MAAARRSALPAAVIVGGVIVIVVTTGTVSIIGWGVVGIGLTPWRSASRSWRSATAKTGPGPGSRAPRTSSAAIKARNSARSVAAAHGHLRSKRPRIRLSARGLGNLGLVEVDLDAWLSEPQVRTRHRHSARAPAERLWDAARSVRICDAPALGRVVRWRIPGTAPGLEFGDLFRGYPFALLAEGEDWSISGLCGRIWTIRRDYPRIAGSDEFRAWSEPGTVRVAFAHWVEPERDGRSALLSEARIQPVDRRARVRTRALWTAIGHFERLIGGEALRVAARRAERG